MGLFFFFSQYYTVVRNVKKAHQIQESGEFQEFNDDVEYILDALQDNNAIGLRLVLFFLLAKLRLPKPPDQVCSAVTFFVAFFSSINFDSLNYYVLRCLSTITLATKCTEPAFRMHVRAHGTVTKFFRALHDATSDQVSLFKSSSKPGYFSCIFEKFISQKLLGAT